MKKDTQNTTASSCTGPFPIFVLSALILGCVGVSFSNSYYQTVQCPHREFHVPETRGMFVISAKYWNSKRARQKWDRFVDHWSVRCPNLAFEICDAAIDPRMGVGVAKALVKCMRRAYDTHAQWAYVFEDDARLFDDGDDLFCDDKFRDSLTSSIPDDVGMLMLGGNHFKKNEKIPAVNLTISDQTYNLWRAEFSWGAYGMMIRRRHLLGMAQFWEDDVPFTSGGISLWSDNATALGLAPAYSPDLTMYWYYRNRDQKVSVIDPLIIDHDSSQYSFTWKQQGLQSAWAGNRTPEFVSH